MPRNRTTPFCWMPCTGPVSRTTAPAEGETSPPASDEASADSQSTSAERDCGGHSPASSPSGAVVVAVSRTWPDDVQTKVAPVPVGVTVPVPVPASSVGSTEKVTIAPVGSVVAVMLIGAPTTTSAGVTVNEAMVGQTVVGFVCTTTVASISTDPVPASAITKPPSPTSQTSVSPTCVVCSTRMANDAGALAQTSPAVSVAVKEIV